MRIIDEVTQQEITNPDLTVGELIYAPAWVSPEAYAQAEAEGLPAVPDSAYEEVQIYHVWTADEIAQREEADAQAARQAVINAMPETLDAYADETDAALFDLDAAQATYETDTDAALFDLAEYAAALEARIAALEAM